MKKILTTLLAASLMLLGTQAFAQASINAGYLNSTLSSPNEDPFNSNGLYAGFTYNLPLVGELGVAPGLYYSVISSKGFESWMGLASASGKFTEHAINVPLYLNYGFDFGRDTRFFIFAGPTARYGLASRVKLDVNTVIGSGSQTTNNYDNEHYNRFNVYLGGGIGFTAGPIQVTVGYDYGMLNQYKGDNQPVAHRSNLKIGAGFAF